MLTTIFLVFIVAFLVLLTRNNICSKYYKFISLIPVFLFIYFSVYLIYVQSGSTLLVPNSWIPSLGIDLNLKVDGLSILFALLITGIGSLVFFYASYYLKTNSYINRFFCYLILFMGAMLGLVMSDNLISVFIFWELTSITSFFLIGFNNDKESRSSAISALSITGLGGFFMLGGFILIGNIAGTYSITELTSVHTLLQEDKLFPLVLFLIFGGTFTKSAQFPFHFWLPGAMQAPTPVSAYLHSATMVKAGIYILARMNPILSDGFIWNNTLMIVGGFTMCYGSFHSIFRNDMKEILAYSTISALGIIVFLIGIGNSYALYAAITLILVHALYKATLFLVTGIVDHSVHTRNITKLSGLRKIMPTVFLASLVAALSSAGIPFTFGFISKDLIYESTLHIPQWSIGITIIVISTNILLACSGFMVGIKPFMGKLDSIHDKVEKPSLFLWIPVVILSSLTLIFGCFPVLADEGILKFSNQVLAHNSSNLHLKIWHGFNTVLFLSGITIVLGFAFYLSKKNSDIALKFISKFDRISPKNTIWSTVEKIRHFAFQYTRFFHNGYLRNYLITIIIFITLLVGYRLFTTVPWIQINTGELSDFRIYEFTIFIIILIAICITLRTSSRLTAIASLGIIGYCICLIFVFYGAPDLAMTQFTIDTLTVILFVLVLFKLPSFLSYKNRKIVCRDIIISVCFGVLITVITIQALISPSTKEISKFYADNAYSLAKGKNVVNVILVDFRGFDTMIETIVLSIAALGVYGLLKYKTNHGEERDY